MSQGRLLVVHLCHCCPHLLRDRVLPTFWLSLEVAASPNRLDFPDNQSLLPMYYHQITLSIPQLYRECSSARQLSSCSSFNRVGAVVQVLPEHQLRDDHHGLVGVVRQCLQTLQCRLLGLVVLDITVLVKRLLKTWGVRGEQSSCHLRGWLGLRGGQSSCHLRGWLGLRDGQSSCHLRGWLGLRCRWGLLWWCWRA